LTSLLRREGFVPLMGAQFISALADNALLLVAMALLVEQGQAAFWVPLLKLMFTLSYVVLGPWVGVCADTWPKQKVMMVANGVKALACMAMLWGVNPLLAFAIVGVGAAVYAPAKYGLVTELAQPEQLVIANAWIEISTVSAVLLGVVLGGALVSPAWLQPTWVQAWSSFQGLESVYAASLAMLLACYGLAAVLNLFIQGSGRVYTLMPWQLTALLNGFWQDLKSLWRDPLGSISLSVTTLFWGVGASLQLIVLSWAQESLFLSLSQAAYLQAATAVGVMAGAALAARWVALHQATRVLGLGLAMGALLPIMLWVTQWQTAVLLTALLGMVGGFFVVPMNALLQHRGVVLLSAGRSIAIQNVNENASILAMMAAYSGLLYFQAKVEDLILALAFLMIAVMARVVWRYQSMKPPSA
jgi:MFS transporter, LPLT family, lysophospholipid transporter